jgi:FtsH-binding integral membrane protein
MPEDSMFSNPVWDRQYDTDRSTVSRQLYMLLVCGWTAAGVALSAIMSFISQDWPVDSWGKWGFIGFIIVVTLVALGGVFIANSSDNPVVSALGYALVAGPFGLMLGPVVALYETSSVIKVFALTSMVVLVLGLVGVLIPDDLSSWGTPLLGALLLLLGGYFIVPLLGFFGIPVSGAMTALDWVGLIVFGALVIFDLNRAVRLPHTVDNAIDSAVAIYLDFINIFIRLLSRMGQKKS